MRMRNLLLFALLLAAAAAGAQSAVGGQMVPRRLVLFVGVQSGSSFTTGDATMIARSVLNRLQESSAEFTVMEGPSAEGNRPADRLTAAAKSAGADSWLQIILDGSWASAQLTVKSFDLLSSALILDFSAKRSAWESPGGLAQESWDDVVNAVAERLHMVDGPAVVAASAPGATLTIKALPGSVITGLGAQAVRVSPGGSTSRTLPALREYVLRAELNGYETVTQRFFLSGDREIAIDQRKKTQWRFELSLLDAQAPGFDVTLPTPLASGFLRFGFSTYALGLAFSSTRLLLNDPLTSMIMQAGMYLGPEDRPFRFSVGLGGFVRLVHAAGSLPTMDSLSPGGIRLSVGSELPAMGGGRPYFEYTPTLYQTGVPDMLRAALGQDYAPGWIFGQSAALSLISFRIGYRWKL
jgi:hypothetical protein